MIRIVYSREGEDMKYDEYHGRKAARSPYPEQLILFLVPDACLVLGDIRLNGKYGSDNHVYCHKRQKKIVYALIDYGCDAGKVKDPENRMDHEDQYQKVAYDHVYFSHLTTHIAISSLPSTMPLPPRFSYSCSDITIISNFPYFALDITSIDVSDLTVI